MAMRLRYAATRHLVLSAGMVLQAEDPIRVARDSSGCASPMLLPLPYALSGTNLPLSTHCPNLVQKRVADSCLCYAPTPCYAMPAMCYGAMALAVLRHGVEAVLKGRGWGFQEEGLEKLMELLKDMKLLIITI
eukprot:1451145-Rhodomonas_salina.3